MGARPAIAILVVYLCAALPWSDRRWDLIIVLVASLLAIVMPVIHMTGAGLGFNRSAGAFFFSRNSRSFVSLRMTQRVAESPSPAHELPLYPQPISRR